MNRILYTLLLAIMLPTTLLAESLVDMTSAIESLGSYEVSFTLESEGYGVEGNYAVDGDKFYFKMDSQEIYGDSRERCTINHANREVVLESIEESVSAPMLIINPIQAFTMLGDDCEIVKVERSGDRVAIHLKPTLDDGMILNSILEVDEDSNLPISVTYFSDSESIKISVGEFAPRKKNLSLQYPEEYEVIDIR